MSEIAVLLLVFGFFTVFDDHFGGGLVLGLGALLLIVERIAQVWQIKKQGDEE